MPLDTERLEKYSVEDLAAMPTISQGQADDLKYQHLNVRWWLARCGEEDGQEYPIMVEIEVMGRWEEVHKYGDWDQWRDIKDDDEEESQAEEPEEGDYTSTDHCKWYQYGKCVLSLTPEDDHVAALKAHMDQNKFWPNAFFISDHGNTVLIDMNG